MRRPHDPRLVQPKLHILESRLLKLGGRMVNLRPEAEIDKMLRRSRVWRPEVDGLILVGGMAHQCHLNSARYYNANPGKGLKIATGYGLTMEWRGAGFDKRSGTWDQHSWLIYPDGKVVETTSGRNVYYGWVLNEEEAEHFVASEMMGAGLGGFSAGLVRKS